MPTRAMAIALIMEAYYQILRLPGEPEEAVLPETEPYRVAFLGIVRDDPLMVLTDINRCLGDHGLPWLMAHLN